MNLVSAKIGVDAVKIRLVLHTFPQVFALAHDVAQLIIPVGAQPVGPDNVTRLTFSGWKGQGADTRVGEMDLSVGLAALMLPHAISGR